MSGRFQKRKGNIFVLDHLIQKENYKEKGKIYALFVDLKAAFDNVERKQLSWKIIREKKIDKEIIRKIELIYDRTEIVIRRNKERIDRKIQDNERRQARLCDESTFIQLVYRGHKEDIGKTKYRRNRIRTRNRSLEYADDMVFVAKNREAMLNMMDSIRRFF